MKLTFWDSADREEKSTKSVTFSMYSKLYSNNNKVILAFRVSANLNSTRLLKTLKVMQLHTDFTSFYHLRWASTDSGRGLQSAARVLSPVNTWMRARAGNAQSWGNSSACASQKSGGSAQHTQDRLSLFSLGHDFSFLYIMNIITVKVVIT